MSSFSFFERERERERENCLRMCALTYACAYVLAHPRFQTCALSYKRTFVRSVDLQSHKYIDACLSASAVDAITF